MMTECLFLDIYMTDGSRCMPKRPCAILVTPDNKTILCGDKFGDVYSLPLIPQVSQDTDSAQDVAKISEALPKAYVPTASNLTVHTARNRRALESQLRQKDLQAKTKEALKFDHQLLLGHVSMLTDVLFTTQVVDEHTRNFIITSDRDEHLRISRGPPQAHVIERYCLGHKEFISKLCLLPETSVFVSGGGDDWLGLWDLLSGEMHGRVDVKAAINEFSLQTQPSLQHEDDDAIRVAVSGIWAVKEPESGSNVLLFASERVPAVFVVLASTTRMESIRPTAIKLPGNPLDISTSGSSIIVSVDTSKVTILVTGRLHDTQLTIL